MATLHNNNIREDAVFRRRVTEVLLRHGGTGALVNVLVDFNAREAAAVQQLSQSGAAAPAGRGRGTYENDIGLTYPQFLAFLHDYGVELSEFEAAYLCRAFDDHGSGYISAATFTRHLTGLNERRQQAVKKAWRVLEQRDGSASGGVARETLLSTYASVAADRAHVAAGAGAATGSPSSPAGGGAPAESAALEAATTAAFSSPMGGALASTFGGADPTRETLKSAYLASLMGRSATAAPGDEEAAADRVSYAEYLAFYAGVSPQFTTDESFVTHVLQSWAADEATRPVLAETAREWGPAGDPLAQDAPRYVKDALNTQLGLSSKAYNYTHMQRVHPYVEPLPPLNRPEIMTTTVQRVYGTVDAAGRTLANPLSTRRDQER